MINRRNRKYIAIVAAVLGFTAALTGFLRGAGSIEYRFGESALTVHTKLWKDVEICYADISEAEEIEELDFGKRTNGYGSPKLNLGSFSNEMFGDYLLYCHIDCSPLILVRMNDGSVIVLGGKDMTETESILEKIRGNMAETSAAAGIIYETDEGEKEGKIASGSDAEPIVFDFLTADFDNDGEEEYIEVTPGPTSGLFTIRVMIKDSGKSFSNYFLPACFSDRITLKQESGKIYLDIGEGGKYALSLENGKVVLTNGTEKMEYWGN